MIKHENSVSLLVGSVSCTVDPFPYKNTARERLACLTWVKIAQGQAAQGGL